MRAVRTVRKQKVRCFCCGRESYRCKGSKRCEQCEAKSLWRRDCRWCGKSYVGTAPYYCSKICRKAASKKARFTPIRFCEQCKKSYDARKHKDNKKYCSRECSVRHKRKTPEYSTCLVCGVVFKTRTRRTTHDANKCCSRKCGAKQSAVTRMRNPQVHEFRCVCCGDKAVGRLGKKYCSRSCARRNGREAYERRRDANRPQSLNCGNCGRDFSPWRAGLKYCGECSGNKGHHQKYYSYTPRPKHEKQCRLCGKSFESIASGKWCSEGCAKAARRRYRGLLSDELPKEYVDAVRALRQFRQKVDTHYKEGFNARSEENQANGF